MKLSEYAKRQGVCYKTVLRWWHKGYIKGRQMPSGTIIIYESEIEDGEEKVVN